MATGSSQTYTFDIFIRKFVLPTLVTAAGFALLSLVKTVWNNIIKDLAKEIKDFVYDKLGPYKVKITSINLFINYIGILPVLLYLCFFMIFLFIHNQTPPTDVHNGKLLF